MREKPGNWRYVISASTCLTPDLGDRVPRMSRVRWSYGNKESDGQRYTVS